MPTAEQPLTPRDLQKLIAILGMLGSDFAGERASAALAADRMVRGQGRRWEDVLAMPALPSPTQPARARSQPKPEDPDADLDLCRRHRDALSNWEKQFVDGLGQWRGHLSPKQTGRLSMIARRLRREGVR